MAREGIFLSNALTYCPRGWVRNIGLGTSVRSRFNQSKGLILNSNVMHFLLRFLCLNDNITSGSKSSLDSYSATSDCIYKKYLKTVNTLYFIIIEITLKRAKNIVRIKNCIFDNSYIIAKRRSEFFVLAVLCKIQ